MAVPASALNYVRPTTTVFELESLEGLPCGCVAGVYETYDGEVVTLVDERDSTCQIDTHENGNRIPDLGPVTASSKVALQK